ncbi:MAG: hypothetical protein AB7K68_09170 [Bacteriovoracia bacterium]
MTAPKSVWFALLSVLLPVAAQGAACCGGGFALPSLIAGDDKAQLSSSYSFSEVSVDNVDARGIWRKWGEHQRVQTFRLEGAHLLSDRWQAGFSAPVVRRTLSGQTYSGLGDLAGSVAYEILPDWDYNPFRPKGIAFFQVTAPTGKSKAESEVGGLDSRGNGFWALGAGALLSKSIRSVDGFLSFEAHRSLGKEYATSQLTGQLKPGWGGSAGLGGGYNTKLWRFGSSITWFYEDPVEIKGAINFAGSLERYATGVLSASFMPSDLWSGTLSYADQTLFGSPANTSLARTVALLVQRRWGR